MQSLKDRLGRLIAVKYEKNMKEKRIKGRN